MRIVLTAFIATTCLYSELPTSLVVPGGEFVATGTPAVIRPIVGIRGSRVMGAPLTSPGTAVAAPGGAFAILENAGSLSVVRTLVTDAAPVYLRPAADQIVFSSAGTSAAFLDATSATVEVWTGFPAAPRLQKTLSAAAPSGVLSALEITDDGEVCLGVSESGDVYELSGGNAPRRSALPRQVRRIRFVPNTRNLLVLDASGQMATASLSTGDISPLPVVAETEFQNVVLSNDGESALAVSSDSLVLMRLDRNEPKSLPWKRGVSRLASLRDGQFAITVADEPGAWIVNRDATLTYVAEY